MSAAGDRLLADIHARTINLERNQSDFVSEIKSLHRTIRNQAGGARRLSGSTRDADRPIPPSVTAGHSARVAKKEMRDFFKALTGKKVLGAGAGLGFLALFGDLLNPDAMLQDIGKRISSRAGKMKDAVLNKMDDYLKAATDMIMGRDTAPEASWYDERRQLDKLRATESALAESIIDSVTETVEDLGNKGEDLAKDFYNNKVNTPENKAKAIETFQRLYDALKPNTSKWGEGIKRWWQKAQEQRERDEAANRTTEEHWVGYRRTNGNNQPQVAQASTENPERHHGEPGFNDPSPRRSIISQGQLDAAGDAASVALQQTSSTMWQKAMQPLAKSIEKAMEKSAFLTGGIKWKELMQLGPFKTWGLVGKTGQGALSVGSRVGVRAIPFIGQGVMTHDVLSSGIGIFDSMAEQSLDISSNDPGGTKKKLKWAKKRLTDDQYALYKRFVEAQQTRHRLGGLGDPTTERSAWTGEPALWLMRKLSGLKDPVRTKEEDLRYNAAEELIRENITEFGTVQDKLHEVEKFDEEQRRIEIQQKMKREKKNEGTGVDPVQQGINVNSTTNNFLNTPEPPPVDMFSEGPTLKQWLN